MMTLPSYRFIALFMSCAAVGFAGTLSNPMDLDTTVKSTIENFLRLALANNDLALSIHRELASRSKENILFSPLSLSTAFGMLYYGTRGNTSKELRKVLGYETAGLPEEHIPHIFQKYLTEALPSQDPSAYVLNLANAILLNKRLDLVKSYKTDVEDLYKSSVREVNFTTQSSQITSEINDWVKNKTNGKIEKLLEDLDPATAFVILSAAHFKGKWKTPFVSGETGPGLFFNHGLQDKAKEVNVMRMKNWFFYTEDDDVQVLEMPYEGENASMIILLPKVLNGLERFEKSLTVEKLFTYRYRFRIVPIALEIPKFKVMYSTELSRVFQSIGAKSVFTPGAELSGIISTPNVSVSQVLHKAVFEVNEAGSEGATVSQRRVVMYRRFNVNRPFLFAIIDSTYEMMLLEGRITNL